MALSGSASGRTTSGFLPPSSSVTGMIFSAAPRNIAEAVDIEPISDGFAPDGLET